MSEKLLEIGIDELMPDPTQPRKTFLADEIASLAKSVAARGILQPLRVLYDPERKKWRIVTGESRWHAARQAGLTSLPCVPVSGTPSEADILADQVIENTCRNALRPLELARALAKLKALKKSSSQQLAAELGLSGGSITRAEALLTLPEDIQAMVDSGRISADAGYHLSRMTDAAGQRDLAHALAAGLINRDGIAKAVRKGKGGGKPATTPGHWSCKADGVSVTVRAGQEVTPDMLIKLSDQLRKEAKKLQDAKAALPLPQVARV